MVHEMLFSSLYLWILTISSGVVLAVIIHYYWNWPCWKQSDIADDEYHERATKYDDFSSCKSVGCVRCQNYNELTTDLMERFLSFKESQHESEPEINLLTERLQDSVERCLKTGGDRPNSPTGKPPLQNPNVFKFEGLRANPWHDGDFTSEVSILEKSALAIKQEYRELLTEQNISENFDGWLENSVPTGVWSVFHLFNQGQKIEENCAKCPKTVAILETLGQVLMKDCAFGNIMFSVLEAGTHITEHCGPCNLRIRCHLGLHVPPRCCTLTVAQESREWHEEKCLLFDDSFLHEARHQGADDKGPRVVLMMDFWHPDITEAEKQALRHIFSLK